MYETRECGCLVFDVADGALVHHARVGMIPPPADLAEASVLFCLFFSRHVVPNG